MDNRQKKDLETAQKELSEKYKFSTLSYHPTIFRDAFFSHEVTDLIKVFSYSNAFFCTYYSAYAHVCLFSYSDKSLGFFIFKSGYTLFHEILEFNSFKYYSIKPLYKAVNKRLEELYADCFEGRKEIFNPDSNMYITMLQLVKTYYEQEENTILDIERIYESNAKL